MKYFVRFGFQHSVGLASNSKVSACLCYGRLPAELPVTGLSGQSDARALPDSEFSAGLVRQGSGRKPLVAGGPRTSSR
jgi:hypothetical protein